MKGQTTIELTNVINGKKENYVDCNMITDAVSEVLKTRGLIGNYDVPRNELVKSLLGGVVCFDEALTESAGNVFPPASATMIGNAVMDITSADDVVEMGSYNANESGWQQDGSFLAVYDFNTSQANGTIACVCLTSDIGSYIGYGNSISGKRKDLIQAYQRMESFPVTYAMAGYTPVRMDYSASSVDMIQNVNLDYNNATTYFMNTGKLKIERYKIPLSKVNLTCLTNSFTKVSETEITIPDEFKSSNIQTIVRVDGNDIYIIPMGTWANSGTLKILKIDSNNETSIISLINTTGASLYLQSFDFYVITEGCFIYWNSSNISTVYKVRLSDSSTTEIANIDSTYLTAYGDLWLVKNGRIFIYGKVININDDTISYINGYGNTSGLYSAMTNVANHPLMTFEQNALGAMYPRMLNMYLASINNLETPVVKTAEKTMKISYRIMF